MKRRNGDEETEMWLLVSIYDEVIGNEIYVGEE